MDREIIATKIKVLQSLSTVSFVFLCLGGRKSNHRDCSEFLVSEFLVSEFLVSEFLVALETSGLA